MRSTCSHEELQNIIKQDIKEHPAINNNNNNKKKKKKIQ
jgi:hypothetical protein